MSNEAKLNSQSHSNPSIFNHFSSIPDLSFSPKKTDSRSSPVFSVVSSVFPTFRPGGGPGRSSPHRGRRHEPRAPAAPGAAALPPAPQRRRRPADPTKGAAGHGVDGGGCLGSNETREDLGDLDWIGGWKMVEILE